MSWAAAAPGFSKRGFLIDQRKAIGVVKIPTALILALFLWACSTGPQPAGLSDLKPVSGHPDDVKVERSRWVGIGSYDACGLSWALDLDQVGNRVTGRFLWETVRYDLIGTLTKEGRLHNVRAGKSPDFNGTPAPRFVLVSLDFGATRAIGYYAAETKNSNDCATAVELKRYATDDASAPSMSDAEERTPRPDGARL